MNQQPNNLEKVYKMKKLITVAAALLFTSAAFANNVTVYQDTKLVSPLYDTKAEAFNAGFDIADNLDNFSQKELRNKFFIISQNFATNIKVTDKVVKTQEFAKNRGNVQYRAIVKVNYKFKTIDED